MFVLVVKCSSICVASPMVLLGFHIFCGFHFPCVFCWIPSHLPPSVGGTPWWDIVGTYSPFPVILIWSELLQVCDGGFSFSRGRFSICSSDLYGYYWFPEGAALNSVETMSRGDWYRLHSASWESFESCGSAAFWNCSMPSQSWWWWSKDVNIISNVVRFCFCGWVDASSLQSIPAGILHPGSGPDGLHQTA